MGPHVRCLEQRHKSGSHFSQSKVPCRGRRALSDICNGLYMLHTNKICHLDMKTPNVLISEDFTCKISDLGLGKFLRADATMCTAESLGSFLWMPPEVIAGKCCLASDIWSLSTIIWEVLSSTPLLTLIDLLWSHTLTAVCNPIFCCFCWRFDCHAISLQYCQHVSLVSVIGDSLFLCIVCYIAVSILKKDLLHDEHTNPCQ